MFCRVWCLCIDICIGHLLCSRTSWNLLDLHDFVLWRDLSTLEQYLHAIVAQCYFFSKIKILNSIEGHVKLIIMFENVRLTLGARVITVLSLKHPQWVFLVGWGGCLLVQRSCLPLIWRYVLSLQECYPCWAQSKMYHSLNGCISVGLLFISQSVE